MSTRKTRPRGTGKRASKVPEEKRQKKKRAWFSGMRAKDPNVAIVEAIMAEKDPKKRWQMEQALAMSEAVRVATAEGEAQARRAHELGAAHPSETIGPSELLGMLKRDIQREE